jgi:hypothetical protein
MHGRPIIESTRPRDCTTRPTTLAAVLDWLLAAATAAAVITALVGFDIHIGGLVIRAHGATRIGLLVVILSAARLWQGVGAKAAWLARIALLTAISASVMTWFRFLLQIWDA